MKLQGEDFFKKNIELSQKFYINWINRPANMFSKDEDLKVKKI